MKKYNIYKNCAHSPYSKDLNSESCILDYGSATNKRTKRFCTREKDY